MERIERIGLRRAGPDRLVPVSANRRVDPREPDDDERRRDAQREPRPSRPKRPADPPGDGHVDVEA